MQKSWFKHRFILGATCKGAMLVNGIMKRGVEGNRDVKKWRLWNYELDVDLNRNFASEIGDLSFRIQGSTATNPGFQFAKHSQIVIYLINTSSIRPVCI